MMASHRPADTPAPPPPEPTPVSPTSPGTKTTLPESNFLVGFDWILAVGVLVLAFLAASFSVRNADFWMHLATGRLLAEGNYQFGKDPFSYVGADRTWVNHAWLFDWLLYQLYKAAEGPGVVVAKAILVTLTAGLLLLARKPGQSIFPGAVCVGLALVAAAPRMLVQPTVISFLFLAALMYLLIRTPKRAGSWSFPIAIAVLFCVWSNCDQWFFLGPLFLLLYTAGQYIRPDEGEDVGTLWKALAVGALACMLNPHHVRVWTLPPELVNQPMREQMRDDLELSQLIRGGLDSEAWDFAANAVNPTALIALLALCAIGFAVNYRHMSAALALIVLGGLVMAALHLRAMPFLVFATAPIAALNLSAAGRRLAATPMTEGQVRGVHALRSGGRAAVAVVGVILIAVSYAGWLHPFSVQRRWKWDVEPNQSLVRAAERMQQWRTSGALPPEARLLNLQPEIANYIAWFAPAEKTYFDFRLRFHADEVADYVALRRYLAPRDPQERKRDPYDLNAFLRKHRITHAVSAHPSRSYHFAAVAALWGQEIDPVAGAEWVLWGVEGRAVMLGWTKQEVIPPSTFDRMRFDPLHAAYVEVQPLPFNRDALRPPLPPGDIWERFVVPPPMAPAEGEEALVLMLYQQSLVRRSAARHQAGMFGLHLLTATRLMTPAATYWTYMPLVQHPQLQSLFPVPMPAEINAVAILAVRAARKAVASSPDHSDGYFYLAKAYTDATFGVFPEQRTVATASLARCRVRLPDDPKTARTGIDVVDLCDELALAHASDTPARLDLLNEVVTMSVEYLKEEIEVQERNLEKFSGETRERAEKHVDDLRKDLSRREKQLKEAKVDLTRATDRFINESSGKPTLVQAYLARQAGLVREAIVALRMEHERFQKQLQAEGDKAKFSSADLALQLAVHAELIALLLYVGQVEEAAQILDSVDTPVTAALMTTDAVRMEYRNVRRQGLDPSVHYRMLRHAVAFCIGDFDRANEAQKKDAAAIDRELRSFRDLNFPGDLPPPKLPGPLDLPLDLQFRATLSPLAPVAAMVGIMGRLEHYKKVHILLQLVEAQIQTNVRIGLTHLEWGNVAEATHYFKQALEPKEFQTPTREQRVAREYLRAIERAQAGRGASR